jgi:lipopolysaccharide assembly outer membrane protein LptD (OstA)
LSSSAIFIERYDDGWTHKAIPSVSLRAQHALVAPSNIPDNFDGNDSLQEGRLAELSLRQFFYAPNSDRPWLDMQFLQPYYLTASTSLGSSLMPFSAANMGRGLGPTEMRMRWAPAVYGSAFKGMSALINMRYDFELDRADEIVAQISMRPRSNYFYGLNYLETNGTPQDFSLGSAYAGFRVSEEWSASIRKSRNFSGDAGFYSKWEVTHYGHDFNLQVGYTLVESTGVDGIYFSISPRFAKDKFDSFDYDLRDLY